MMGRENSSGVRFSLLRMDRRFCESGVRGVGCGVMSLTVAIVSGEGNGSGVYPVMSATGSVGTGTDIGVGTTTGSGVIAGTGSDVDVGTRIGSGAVNTGGGR